jgi:exonuclease SbcC
MQLHRLRMTAIGPFRDPTELDLAKFGDSGLFLVEGATGAGKSTILDAVCFALYGRLARTGASAERLKSHHAPLGTEPVVELVFETQSGHYRIRRTAPYDRAKKRGQGTLPVPMQVWLFRLTDPDDLDGGELISNKHGEAEDEITRAVGLSHGQFVQTVLLPQGEFANFLSAKTETKRDLLQKLFGTEILERTQARLIEGRQHAEKSRKAAVEAVRAAVNAFAGLAEVDDATVAELVAAAERGDTEPLSAALTQRLESLSAAVTASSAVAAQAEQARIAQESGLRSATELARRRLQRDRLSDERARLLASSADQDEARRQLSAAERAAGVTSAAEAVRTAVQALDEARAAEAAARGRLSSDLVDADDRGLRDASSGLAATLGSLDAELIREQELASHRRRFRRLEAEQAEQLSLVELGEAQLAALPVRQRELTAELTLAERASAQLPSLIAERDRAVLRLKAANEAEVAAAAAAQDKLVAQELFDAAERAEQRVALLRQQWRASIASELGLALQTGDPCSVCGSVEHPQPARPSAGHVSQKQLQQAEQDLSGLQEQVELRRAQLADKQAELMQLQLAADQLTPDKAQATLDKVSGDLGRLAAEADRLSGLTDELQQLESQLTELQAAMSTARSAVAQRTEQLTNVSQNIDRDEQALAAARADFDTVASRVAALQAQLKAMQNAAAAIDRTRTLLAAATTAGDIFAQALEHAQFADEAAWRAAVRGSAEMTQLRERLRRYDDQLNQVQARLSADELTDPALDAEPADLPTLQAQAESAQRAEQLASREHGAAAERLAKGSELANRIRRAVAGSQTVLASTAAAVRIGNLVAGLGENQLKLELTTYVLVRRFAEVLAAANGQLQRISQGRYQLEHTDARTGSAKSGLNLRVLDLHTGKPRDPATLSGGETFYVSLALALGLADVVRAESGGIDLGTLFIDEGFGTLDAEVLDGVIDVLDGLRDGGRAVGIVSHVSELKMRIADRIKVERNIDGTSKLLTTV